MKVSLVNPPPLANFEPWVDQPDFPRTSLAYLAGHLREHNDCEIFLVDAKFDRLNFEETIHRICESQPNIVGFTAFTNEIKPAAYVAARVKEILPEALTVIGGVHVTAIPEQTLKEFPQFDMGVIGEGEHTLNEIVNALKNHSPFDQIPGIIFRDKDQNIRRSNTRNRVIDQNLISEPAWDLFRAGKEYNIQTQRGCPFRCVFCMNPNGIMPRIRSDESVIEELKYLKSLGTVKKINFGDELFSVDKERTMRLMKKIGELKLLEGPYVEIQTHCRYVDEEVFQSLKEAGVTMVQLGIESGDPNLLRGMGKGISMELIEEATKAARKVGSQFGTFFLLGQPNESVKSILSTIRLAIKISPDLPIFGIMVPYPGTRVAQFAIEGKNGYVLQSTDWDEYNKQLGGALTFANISRRQIELLQIFGYLSIFLANFRFKDLFAFVWEWRIGAISVLKKLVRGGGITDMVKYPEGYHEKTSHAKIDPQLVYDESKQWDKYQVSQLSLARKELKQRESASS